MGVMKELATRRMMGENIAWAARACGLTNAELGYFLLQHEHQHRLFKEASERKWEIAEDLAINSDLQQLVTEEEEEHVSTDPCED